MNEISSAELDELFIDTLERASIKLLSLDDEEISYQIFEEFDSGAVSFLHIDSLQKLQAAGFINEEIKHLSLQLREMSLQLLNGEKPRDAETVRADADWHKVLELSDNIRSLKSDFDKGRSMSHK